MFAITKKDITKESLTRVQVHCTYLREYQDFSKPSLPLDFNMTNNTFQGVIFVTCLQQDIRTCSKTLAQKCDKYNHATSAKIS